MAAHGLIEAYGNSLLSFVLRRTGGPIEDAEEIVQDTLVTAVRLCSTFEGGCSFFTWLCCLAKFRILDYQKRQNAQKRAPEHRRTKISDEDLEQIRRVHDPHASIDEIVEQIDRVRLIQSLLDCMTPEQHEALTLRYVEGFSLSEIALIMKRSTKAVERLIERAKERPRAELYRWFSDESFRALCWDLIVL